MSDMKDREEGFERKFAFDEELRFKATARRNKLLGLWAAEKLGKIRRRRRRLCQGSGRRPISRKPATTMCSARSRADFDAAGVDQSDHQIRRTMDELMAQAIEQIKNA